MDQSKAKRKSIVVKSVRILEFRFTNRFANVHVAAILDDDLALFGCRPIGERFDVLMDDVLFTDFRSHWSAELFDNEENDKEKKKGNREAYGEYDEG